MLSVLAEAVGVGVVESLCKVSECGGCRMGLSRHPE